MSNAERVNRQQHYIAVANAWSQVRAAGHAVIRAAKAWGRRNLPGGMGDGPASHALGDALAALEDAEKARDEAQTKLDALVGGKP